MKPVIGITIGDPAGIGPEIVLKAVARRDVRAAASLIVFGDRSALVRTAGVSAVKRALRGVALVDFQNHFSKSIRMGVASARMGKASGDYIAAAVRAAQQRVIDAMVTAPINKVSFRMGGWGRKYIGHTEMLAGLTGSSRTALMLIHDSLRAIHVTSHVPLRRVPYLITEKRVRETIELAHSGLVAMGVRNPLIAVCGLNPHAGDQGLFGWEDARVIAPAVQHAKKRGWRVTGPLSADVVWPQVLAKRFDVGVAMYHDQGQIAVKLAGFQPRRAGVLARGVNVTIGLPIVRTSVAHGTAYEIAGKGVASEQSLVDAILLACQMARRNMQ